MWHARGFCFSDDLEEETGFVWDGRYTYINTDSDGYPSWPKSTIGQPKTVKAASKPTTSTATKSASHVDCLMIKATWFGDYYRWETNTY